MKDYKILAINPGSTSTKIGYFINGKLEYSVTVSHDVEKLKSFTEIIDQFPYRKEKILHELSLANISLESVDAFVGRGGGTVSMTCGTYKVNELMLEHTRIGISAKHPANLGSQLAYDFAMTYGGEAYIVNPPDVDEFDDVARVTGIANIYRESKLHALNQKEVGIRYAKSLGKKYNEMNLIICHLGGGISVTAHRKGKMVDSNDIVDGDGPMAPTRAGAIPALPLIKMCYSGKYTEKEMHQKITKNGGLVEHLGTADVQEIIERINNGDRFAKLIIDAMLYQIAKSIGSYHAVLKGKTDAIIFTGGIAKNSYIINEILEYVSSFAISVIMPGEFELEALAAGVLRVIDGEEEEKTYTGIPAWNGFDFKETEKVEN